MQKVKNLVSVIIVTWNSKATIEACLTSLNNYQDKEVIVVDNASSDRTVEVLKKYSEVKLIENEFNEGYGRAANKAVAASKGEFLFFLNPDAMVENKSLEKLCNYLNQNQAAGVVGPTLLNPDKTLQKEISSFPALDSETLILLRLHRVPFFKNLVYPNFNYSEIREAEHLIGAALLVRRHVFEEVGGFDEKFFLWFEDTDLLKRIKDTGSKIVFYPEAVVTHLGGESTKQVNFLKRQAIWNKSLLYYFQKHKGSIQVLLLLPFILLSYPAAFLVNLVKR